MSFKRWFTFQPDSTNSTASQSSRCGWLGFSPWIPKLPGVATRPWPGRSCDRWPTADAERGFLWLCLGLADLYRGRFVSADPLFDRAQTGSLAESLGGTHVEELLEEVA